MYFAKGEFGPDDEMAQRVRLDAQEAMLSAARDFGVTLDGTEGSIGNLDAILDRLHRSVVAGELPKQEAKRFAKIFGSYFGEVVLQAQGAVWGGNQVYASQHSALCIGPTEIVFNPWRWVYDRIEEGFGWDLRTYYEVLVRRIQKVKAAGSEGDQPIPSGKAGVWRERLYPLQPDAGYYYTGTTADGRLVIVSRDIEELMALFFDSAGNLLGYEVHYFSIDVPHSAPEYYPLIWQAEELWKDKIGFQLKPIYVRRFALPEYKIGIQDRPDYYEAFLKAPDLEEPDEEEQEWRFERIRTWDAEDCFVFNWGNDLWLNGYGEVTSS